MPSTPVTEVTSLQKDFNIFKDQIQDAFNELLQQILKAEINEATLGGAQSYLLPLDSLDLTYLSKYVRNANEKTIWSQQRLNGESEYFYVKIEPQSFDEDDCYYEPLDTYTCHICDIDVPKLCYKQHNESPKHETYKKISEKVLERIAKQINIKHIDNERDETKNLYYCTSCSKAVELKNKYKHESSNYHKISEDNLKIINDFYKKFMENGTRKNLPHESYVETDSDSDDSEIVEIIQNDKVNNNLNELPTTNNDIDSTEEFLEATPISDATNIKIAKIQESNTVTELVPPDLSNGSISEKHQPFDVYIKEMILKYKLCVITPIIDGENIVIVPPNGDKVNISREHYHSFRQIKNSVYCQVCKMWISQDTKPHEVTEIHVRNIFKIVNEKYARKIDTVYNHCLICNEVIIMESDHQNISNVHKTLLNNAKIQETTENVDCVIIKTEYCEMCEVEVPQGEMRAHENSESHKEIFSKAICKRLKGCFNLVMQGLKNEFQNSGSFKNKTALTNTGHIESLPSNSAVEATNTSLVSSTTKTKTAKEQTNNAYKDIIKDYHNLLQYTDDTKKTVECKICCIKIPFNGRNIIEHMRGYNHCVILRKKYRKVLRRTDESKLTFVCLICDVNMPDVQTNIYEHMEGQPHKIKKKNFLNFHEIEIKQSISFVRKVEDKYRCLCCDLNVIDFYGHIHTNQHINNLLAKFEISTTTYHEYVYGDTNVRGGEAIQTREFYKSLLRTCKITKTNDSMFFCGMCGEDLPRMKEIDHVLGKEHRLLARAEVRKSLK